MTDEDDGWGAPKGQLRKAPPAAPLPVAPPVPPPRQIVTRPAEPPNRLLWLVIAVIVAIVGFGLALYVQTPTRTIYEPLPFPLVTSVPVPDDGPRKTGAICKDGTRTTSLGSGTCSGHGGIAGYTYDK